MKAWQRSLLLLGLFALFESVYQFFLYLERRYFPTTPVCTLVLGLIVSGLIIAVLILNRGFGGGTVRPEELDPSIPYGRREQLAQKANKRKKIAKTLMLVFIPLAFVFSLDLLDLYFDIFDRIGELFS